MNRASLPIRMRGWFFSMPVMMRCAATGGVVLAIASKRSIDSARRALSVMPIPVRELRTMLVNTPPGCTTESFTGLFAIASSCRRLSEKPRTANFAAQYAVWPGGAMMPKIEERLTICASRCFERCGRNARVPCTTPQKLMLISHSICAWSTSSKAPRRATPALLMTMFSCGWAAMAALREFLDLGGLADIDAVGRYLARGGLADLGRHLLQPGLVAVGERQVAAARGQLQRERAADAAGGAGHGGRASGYRSHGVDSIDGKKRAGSRNFRKLEPNHKALSALNVDYLTEDVAQTDANLPRRLTWDNQNPFVRRRSSSKTIR